MDRARAELFVGRRAELAVIEDLLRPGGAPSVVYVQGAGGNGKTQLLHAAARVARAHGYRVGWIDGKSAPWDRESLTRAVDGLRPEGATPFLLVLDSFEAVATLEIWWREEFLPTQPSSMRILFAGRRRLETAWSEDPGWRDVLRVVALGPLAPVDCREYLRRRRTPADAVSVIIEETRGHPLALALAADLSDTRMAAPSVADGAAIVDTLAERLLEDAPGPRHLQAICAGALVLHLRDHALGTILDVPPQEGALLARYLRSLSFVDITPHGLTMHDLMREAIVEHLRRRDPTLLAGLMARVAAMLRAQLLESPRPELVNEVLYFMSVTKVWAEPHGFREHDLVAAESAHWPAIEELILTQEGAESLDLLRFWRDAGAETLVCVTTSGDVAGFVQMIRLDRIQPTAAARDPGTAALHERWSRRGLMATGRPLRCMRHWGVIGSYQEPGPVQMALFERFMRALMVEDAAAGGSCHAASRGFLDMVSALPKNLPQHIPELDFELGGRAYALLSREFVEESTTEWLVSLVDTTTGALEPPASEQTARDSRGFAEALRQLLRGMDRPDLVESNPLLASRLAGAGSPAERLKRLRDAVREEATELFASPRDRDLRAAFDRTYFGAPGKQEAIAAELNMAYSTYRRHLASAVKRLIDALWRREQATR